MGEYFLFAIQRYPIQISIFVSWQKISRFTDAPVYVLLCLIYYFTSAAVNERLILSTTYRCASNETKYLVRPMKGVLTSTWMRISVEEIKGLRSCPSSTIAWHTWAVIIPALNACHAKNCHDKETGLPCCTWPRISLWWQYLAANPPNKETKQLRQGKIRHFRG